MVKRVGNGTTEHVSLMISLHSMVAFSMHKGIFCICYRLTRQKTLRAQMSPD